MIERIALGEDSYISYKRTGLHSEVVVVCCGGFTSEMHGAKATSLFNYCASSGIDCVVFDYLGHGISSGDFNNYTIHDWYLSCKYVLEFIVKDKPAVLVGTSMGGWLMLLTAMSHEKRVMGLLGLAAAPDFTETLKINELERTEILQSGKATSYIKRMRGVVGLSPELSDTESVDINSCSRILETNGEITIRKGNRSYTINRRLVDSGREHSVLNSDKIPINCPMILIHSMKDRVIPYQSSLKIAEKVCSKNVQVLLTQHGDHLLNDEKSLNIAFAAIQTLITSSHRST